MFQLAHAVHDGTATLVYTTMHIPGHPVAKQQHHKYTLYTRIQCVPSHSLGLFLVTIDNRLEVLEVNVTELIQPEVVESSCDERKVIL